MPIFVYPGLTQTAAENISRELYRLSRPLGGPAESSVTEFLFQVIKHNSRNEYGLVVDTLADLPIHELATTTALEAAFNGDMSPSDASEVRAAVAARGRGAANRVMPATAQGKYVAAGAARADGWPV